MPVVREITLSVAETGLFNPVWSDRIFNEWRIAVARKHGLAAEDAVVAAQAQLSERFPEARVDAVPDAPVPGLPDSADEHVVATAMSSGARRILTFNLRDFPVRTLAAQGLAPVHPDSLLWHALGDPDEDQVVNAVIAALTRCDIVPENARAPLKRARLSRFAKAFEARLSGSPVP